MALRIIKRSKGNNPLRKEVSPALHFFESALVLVSGQWDGKSGQARHPQPRDAFG